MVQEEEDDRAGRQGSKRKERKKERGAKDDWEALKIVMDELPSLKQRVLHKLRSMMNKSTDADNKVSKKAQQAYLREMKKTRKSSKK